MLKIIFQIKQQLPLKLAATTKSPTPAGGSVQQMLPMKLRETGAEGRRSVTPIANVGVGGGYLRLANDPSAAADAGSPPTSPGNSPAPTHARTGSSPAMMEHSASHPGSPARTHSFPKSEEKVIFFWQLMDNLSVLWLRSQPPKWGQLPHGDSRCWLCGLPF